MLSREGRTSRGKDVAAERQKPEAEREGEWQDKPLSSSVRRYHILKMAYSYFYKDAFEYTAI